MSLIEEALRKAARLGTAARGSSASKKQGPVQFKPTSATEVPARIFRKVAIDAQAQERHLLLPALTDVAVLRSYKILRTRVLQRMQAENWHSVAVTGVAAGEGKSFTAINLSIALAQELNTWVYLVDLDLQRPRVADYLGLQADKGLSDFLQGRHDGGMQRFCALFFVIKGYDNRQLGTHERNVVLCSYARQARWSPAHLQESNHSGTAWGKVGLSFTEPAAPIHRIERGHA